VISTVRAVGFASRTRRKTPRPSPFGSFMSISTPYSRQLSICLAASSSWAKAHADASLAEQIPQVVAQVAVVVHNQHQRLFKGLVDQAQKRGKVDWLRDNLPGTGSRASDSVALPA
jgi:hypothetical protein